MALETGTLPVNEVISNETEIRHLPPHILQKLGSILDCHDSWKVLASVIPEPDSQENLLLSASDIRTLEEHQQRRGSPTESILKYWGTFGRNRPNVRILLELLNSNGLMRAAHFVATDLLRQAVPIAEPDLGDPAGLQAGNGFENQHGVPQYRYIMLNNATCGFNERSVGNGGRLLGQGTYGLVFLGVLENGSTVAIKKLKSQVDRQYISELEVLTRFEHPNLLPLLGFSIDGPLPCLIYEYLPKGSLQDCLAAKNDFLLWQTRISIALGTARGINHLHVHESKPLVHRDIKSANILLDSNFHPKLGDFGLARQGSTGTSTAVITATVSGTKVYMSPEAFRGYVSSKWDVFSFGVVLLELLTGLPPFDNQREEDLLTHVQENCDDICKLLDTRAGFWNLDVAVKLYQVSQECNKSFQKERATMAQVIAVLEELCSAIS